MGISDIEWRDWAHPVELTPEEVTKLVGHARNGLSYRALSVMCQSITGDTLVLAIKTPIGIEYWDCRVRRYGNEWTTPCRTCDRLRDDRCSIRYDTSVKPCPNWRLKEEK